MSRQTDRCPRSRSSLGRSAAGRVLAVLAVTLAGAVVGTAPTRAAATTVVSLTFDDGSASQHSVLPILRSHGMKGTFYVNSGYVGSSSYYMTWPELRDVADAGNEIGAHSVHHLDLTTMDTATATSEVCNDRKTLVRKGLGPVVSFAYPNATVNSSTAAIVKSCGYSSGRRVGYGATGETRPPADPYGLRTPPPASADAGLQGLKDSVLATEGTGGWAILVFHGICDNQCTKSSSITRATFSAFLDWLHARSGNGTVVRTVGQVMGSGTSQAAGPTTSMSCGGRTCSNGWYRRGVAVTLSGRSPNGGVTTYYTTDGSDPISSSSRTTYTGPFTVSRTTRVDYYSTDGAGLSDLPKMQRIRIDAAAPRVGITSPGDHTTVGRRLTLTARAVDRGTGGKAPSGIRRVTFYDGRTVVGRVSRPRPGTSRYSLAWRPGTGRHVLTAVARDNAGNATRSTPVRILVRR